MTRRRARGTALATIICTAAAAVACGRFVSVRDRASRESVRQAIMQLADAKTPPVFVTHDREGQRLWKLTRDFYAKRDYAPAWIDGRRPRPQMDDLIHALQNAGADGLDPNLYNAQTLAERRAVAGKGFLTPAGFNEHEAVGLDAWLTYLYLQFSSDLANGLADLSNADPQWKIRGDSFDPLAALEKALSDNHVAQSLDALKPDDPQYKSMRDALAKYRAIDANGGWPALPASLRLKPGQRNPLVPALARRLAISGDYDRSATQISQTDVVYDKGLQEAVKRFQRRHGLEPDGVIGPGVVAEMNVPAATRVRQIELNMERWRWLPRELGERYVFVNVPEYRLEVWDHGKVPVTMRVVVGKQDTPTPIFADDMTYLVFAPYWNVPPDIVEKETLPSVMSDPNFLQRTNMEVVDRKGQPVDPSTIDLSDPSAYRFRQRPGTSNSLGLVKFMFPNQYNVYLHDTPADSLFARATRSFSHGCVRLEQPEKLAEYVLRDQPQWTAGKISEAMHGSEETTVKLREKLPVYIAYFTARVASDGQLQFRRDLYGVDGQQTARLAKVLDRMKQQAAAASKAARTETGLVQKAF